MGAIVPFEQQQLPAHLRAFAGVSDDDLTTGVGGGFPVISIKGKVFHIQRGDDRQLITKGDDGEPAASIEVVLLKANKGVSKIYYVEGYTEGSTEKPTCYSDDGIAPAADAQEKQSTKCGICPHNQWGSRTTEAGKKAKACSDARRIAVAPVGQINDPMLLRVPATSLLPLAQYGDLLKKRGVKYPAVITKIGFDYTVAHPALTFKPVAFLPEESAKQVMEVMNTDMVARIVGLAGREEAPALPAPEAKPAAPQDARVPQGAGTGARTTATAAPQKVEAAPVAKAPPAATPAKAAASKSTSNAFSSGTPEAAPAPAAKKAAPAAQKSKLVEVDTGNLEQELEQVLSAAGFDDQSS